MIYAAIAIAALLAADPIDPKALEPFARVQAPPVDESAADPAFAAFWAAFKQAVARRDAGALAPLLDEKVQVHWDGESGPDALRRKWKLDADPAQSPLWQELDDIIRLGVAREEMRDGSVLFAAPALFVHFPKGYSGYDYSMIAGEKVNVRETPSSSGAVVAQESYTVVRELREPDQKKETIGGIAGEWIRIALPEGKQGYVFSRYLRSPIYTRAIFSKGNAGWKMTALIAGD